MSRSEIFALPITINIVMIVSNILLAVGSVFHHNYLLLPWICLYFVINVFFTGLLVYVMIILKDSWLQTITFLLVAPLLTIAGAKI